MWVIQWDERAFAHPSCLRLSRLAFLPKPRVIQGHDDGQRKSNCEPWERVFLCHFCNMICCFVLLENHIQTTNVVYNPHVRDYEKLNLLRGYRQSITFFYYFIHVCSPSTFATYYWTTYPCSLFLVWLDICDKAESHTGSRSLPHPPILLQPGVGSRNMASPSLVSSVVAVHLLNLCECEGCSPLRQSYFSSTYPVLGWVSLYEVGYRSGAAWLVSTQLRPAFRPCSPLHSRVWQKNFCLVTSGSGKLKLILCKSGIRYL